MFFVASKLLGFLAEPSNLIFLLGAAGIVLTLFRRPRAGMSLMVSAIVLFAIAGYSPLGSLVIEPLEDRFPPWDAGRGPPDGIVVLGGSINPEVSAYRHATQLNESAERLTAAAELARRYPAARIVFTGGSANLILKNAMEGDWAEKLLIGLGVPRERLTIERNARNTAENATFTKALVQPRPGEHWLLVTSAAHMPRAIGIFRKAGFPVEAYPVDYRTRGSGDIVPFNELSAGLARLDTASHEWVGLVAYWLAGKSAELFPAPAPLNPGAAIQADRRP